jgi:hypothetical protein
MTLTVVLVLAALYLLAGKELHAKAAALFAGFRRPEVSWQQAAAAGLLILAVVAFNWQTPVSPSPTPPPAPVPVGPLDLRGLFAGPTGAEDAALVAALTGELSDELRGTGRRRSPTSRPAWRWMNSDAVPARCDAVA